MITTPKNDVDMCRPRTKDLDKAPVSLWIAPEEARAIMAKLILDGTYKKDQVKLSNYRLANGKNKDDGYIVRVIAIKGIHPELENPLTEEEIKAMEAEDKRQKKLAKQRKGLVLKLNAPIAVGSDKWDVLDVQANNERTKLFYLMKTGKNKFAIGHAPFTKSYKNVTIIKTYEKEDAEEESFANFTLQCNLMCTHGLNFDGSDIFIPMAS